MRSPSKKRCAAVPRSERLVQTFAREAIGEAAAAGEKNVLRRYRNDPLNYLEDCVEHREEQLEDAEAVLSAVYGNRALRVEALGVGDILQKAYREE